MRVKKLTSTLNYSSSLTTLVYVNGKGQVATHNYGDLEFGQRENFDIVFDLSPRTLADGCRGIISMTNNNWSSTLGISFDDVFLVGGNMAYAAKLTGAFVADDSNVLDYTGDANCTSLDMTGVSELPKSLPWIGGNRVLYVSGDANMVADNVVGNGVCTSLVLSPDGGDFRPAAGFTAQKASMVLPVDGCRMVMLPFAANVPDGAKAYTIDDNMALAQIDDIPAHTPVLVEASESVSFTGSGRVAFAKSPLTATLRGTYTQIPIYAGDYVLGQQNGQWGFVRLNADDRLSPFGVYAQISSSASFVPLQGDVLSIGRLQKDTLQNEGIYDLWGRKVNTTSPAHGIYIVNGKKMVVK